MPLTFWSDVLGWIGAVMLLAAYGMVSTRRLEGDSRLYQGLNIVGSLFLAFNTAVRGAWPSTTLNAAWILMGFAALAHARRTKAD